MWAQVLEILTSPAGQKLMQSAEDEVIAAIGDLFKHAAAASAVKAPA